MKPLSSVEIYCIQADIMYPTEKEAVEYLKTIGHKMGLRTFQTHKKQIRDNSTARLFYIAKGAKDEQMKIIDELNTIKSQLWILFNESNTETIEKIRILREIREVIPHITAATAAIPNIIKEVIQNFQKTGTEPERDRRTVITAK